MKNYKLKESITEETLILNGYAISKNGYAFKRIGADEIFINLSNVENDTVGRHRQVMSMDSRYELPMNIIEKEIQKGLIEEFDSGRE